MSNVNEKLDELELVKEVKQLEGAIVDKFGEIKSTTEEIQKAVASNQEVSSDLLAKHEALSKQYNEMYDRVQTLEQKGANIRENIADQSIGQKFLENDGVKMVMEKRGTVARMEFKTAIINATGQNQPLVPSDRMGGIATTPNRRLTIRDVLPVESTNSNLVEFTRESGFTNNAGPQIAGSPEAYENVTKPESAITFSLVSVPVVTLAHFIPASRQVLDDADGLAGHINNRLLYGLKLYEETQLLTGTGSNHQLNGLYTQATAYASSASPESANEITRIRDAIRQAQVAEYDPDFLVLNPLDWFDIETRVVGSGDDRYVVGNPNSLMANRLWGLNVIVTNSQAAGTFLLGSSMSAVIKDRQQAAVEMSREDSTNFQKNMVTILAEERLALCVMRTEAFIKGTL